MERSTVIAELQKLGSELALEYGCDTVQIGEDGKKGIYGEKFTELLEKEYGECTKEIKWMNDAGYMIEFRFRFKTPCLSIRYKNGVYGHVLAEIEIDQDWNCEERRCEGDFEIQEMMVWKEDGIVLLERLRKEWAKIKKKYE